MGDSIRVLSTKCTEEPMVEHVVLDEEVEHLLPQPAVISRHQSLLADVRLHTYYLLRTTYYLLRTTYY